MFWISLVALAITLLVLCLVLYGMYRHLKVLENSNALHETELAMHVGPCKACWIPSTAMKSKSKRELNKCAQNFKWHKPLPCVASADTSKLRKKCEQEKCREGDIPSRPESFGPDAKGEDEEDVPSKLELSGSPSNQNLGQKSGSLVTKEVDEDKPWRLELFGSTPKKEDEIIPWSLASKPKRGDEPIPWREGSFTAGLIQQVEMKMKAVGGQETWKINAVKSKSSNGHKLAKKKTGSKSNVADEKNKRNQKRSSSAATKR